jgi:nucleoside-diphosphate-sugar epimerase
MGVDSKSSLNSKVIIVAGANGELGRRICKQLIVRGAIVKGLVRKNISLQQRESLKNTGVKVIETDYGNGMSLPVSCSGAHCLVSALSGLRDVIVDAQTNLLHATIQAKVAKFIPSDYCIDYRNLKPGRNRNLDFRREFADVISKAPIQVTSVLNGMFTGLLRGEAPVILYDKRRIFFWGNADQKMDFTTIEDTAEFTAEAALDASTPRWLKIAGDVASMRDLKKIAGKVFREEFKFLRPGGLPVFKLLIKLTKVFSPGKDEVFPAWQGMQYLYDMLTGVPKFDTLDNNRYPAMKWTTVEKVLAEKKA